ncbi:MAG: hypothetical protein ACPG05_01425 [Bdellovibrionales bacterium]
MGISNLTNNGVLEKYQAQHAEHASKIDIGNSAPVTDVSGAYNMSANPALAGKSFDMNLEAAV